MLKDDAIVQYIFRQVAKGYDHLRKHGIMHRDLKPDNILIHFPNRENELLVTLDHPADIIKRKAVIKIADFGLSYVARSEREFILQPEGTRLFWPPEFFKKQIYDVEAEMWAFGAIMFELKTGVNAFYSTQERELKRRLSLGLFWVDKEC